MARLKNATFEGASLTGVDGADSVVGTVSLDGTSALRGTYAALTNASSSYLRFDYTDSDEIFITAVFKRTGTFTGGRIMYIRAGTTGLLRIQLLASGKVRLENGAGDSIDETVETYGDGVAFRVGAHYIKGTGADAVLEAYIALDGEAFTTPFATVVAGTETGQANRLDIGNTSSGTPNNLYLDSVRIDTTSMPTDDVDGGPTNYPQSISTVITSAPVIHKDLTRYIQAVIAFTVFTIKNINVFKNISISSSLFIQKNIVKYIATIIQSSVDRAVAVSKKLSILLGNTVDITYGRAYDVIINVVSVINVLSPIKIIHKQIQVITQTAIHKASNISIRRLFNTAITAVIGKSSTAQNFSTLIKNSREILLTLKNTAIALLQRNTKTITYKDKNDGS